MSAEGRFTQGSTMRHVVVMTGTASLGLMFMFLIDVATMFWVGQLGDERLLAALGFVWTIQFFTISVGIGLMIPTTALVSRAIGARDRDGARRQATTSLIIAFTVQVLVTLFIVIAAPSLIAGLGATGETAEIAVRFLRISIGALPLMVVGMMGSAILRAEGDAVRSMTITLSAGLLAMVLDPIFIFGLGLGIDGAAYVVVISRIATSILALYYIIRVHDLAAKPSLADVRRLWSPFWVIAIPALVTAMAGPFGNYVVTLVIAEHGDSAVAGLAVVSRLTMLTFGGIFALSGAVGGIFGQNYGAGLPDRVERTFHDAVLFCAGYVALTWALLALGTGLITQAFGLEGTAADVLRAFTLIAAGSFFLNGVTFVANAAFNNLGRPIYSALFTWARDGLLTYPLALLLSAYFLAPGVIYAQALAGVFTGIVAWIYGARFVAKSLRAPVGAT